jgi:hypothetical protein
MSEIIVPGTEQTQEMIAINHELNVQALSYLDALELFHEDQGTIGPDVLKNLRQAHEGLSNFLSRLGDDTRLLVNGPLVLFRDGNLQSQDFVTFDSGSYNLFDVRVLSPETSGCGKTLMLSGDDGENIRWIQVESMQAITC